MAQTRSLTAEPPNFPYISFFSCMQTFLQHTKVGAVFLYMCIYMHDFCTTIAATTRTFQLPLTTGPQLYAIQFCNHNPSRFYYILSHCNLNMCVCVCVCFSGCGCRCIIMFSLYCGAPELSSLREAFIKNAKH